MNIINKETKEQTSLSIIDPRTDVDYIADFIGNADGFQYFDHDETTDTWTCDQVTFDWWITVVADNQALERRIYKLTRLHGYDDVYDVIHAAGNTDLEDHASVINKALDDHFWTVLSSKI